ncbi:integrase core domain protein [Yersinia enterocolitica]|nr:integrase core domain protein [Yersinia enterocolitica]KGA79875.1 integrase core domain protein [Yersinia enterocolitica]CNK41620.1 IS1400 transposase B [Yersinia enterocolitica]CRY38532.1 IS1400 transposase B [Yersinia enterocolitica]
MDGRRFRLFNVVDDFNREALAIDVDLNIPAHRVVRIVERLSAERGYPAFIRSDNDPEFIAAAFAEWAERHGVILDVIQPGKAMQNGFIERFNKTLRTEILDMYLFRSLSEVRILTEQWRTEYNEERPYSLLGNMPPVIYARQKLWPETLTGGGTKNRRDYKAASQMASASTKSFLLLLTKGRTNWGEISLTW